MNQEEAKLRSLIRKGIRITNKRKEKQKIEEQRLRNVLRHLINEVKGTAKVANRVIHKNSGINALDELLRDIIEQIESTYKTLATDERQRKSFRYHFLVNFKNILAPIDANRFAPTTQAALTEQDENPDFTVSIDDELEDDDINAPPDPDKFIPLRPRDEEKANEEKEKEKGFVKLDSSDPDVQQGAAFAEKAFSKVSTQIISTYEDLIQTKDAAAFEDWGLTNLKLYFDMFEDEMTSEGSEPESPEYPPADESVLAEAKLKQAIKEELQNITN